MFCPKCGTQNENDAKFCASCGLDLSGEATVSVAAPQPQQQYQAPQFQAPQPQFQPAQPEQPAKEPKKFDLEKLKENKRAILIGAGAVVAIILVILLISAIFSGSKYERNEFNFSAISEDGEKITVFYNGKEIGSYEVSEDSSASVKDYSKNRDIYVVDAGESLVYVTTKSVEVLDIDADNVWLSDDGKKMVYTYTDPDSEERVTTLNTYDVKSKKSTEIAEDAQNIKVSPDASTVLYNLYEESEDEIKVELWLYKKGEAEKIGKKLNAYAIDNKAKYIYVTDNEGKFYIYNAKDESKEKIEDSVSSAIFNDDKSQVMFIHNGKAYISIKGKEAESLFKASYLSMLSPSFCVADYSDLGDQVYYSGNALYYLNSSKKEFEKLEGDIEGAYLTSDGKGVYYSKYDDNELTIGYVDVKMKAESVELVEEDVKTFDITSDGKIYYITEDDELMLYNKKKPIKVADDVDSLNVTHNDVVLFEQDETLFYVKGKSDKEKISDDVYNYGCSAKYVYYRTEYSEDKGTCDVYVSKNGKKFENLGKEVHFSTGVSVYIY